MDRRNVEQIIIPPVKRKEMLKELRQEIKNGASTNI